MGHPTDPRRHTEPIALTDDIHTEWSPVSEHVSALGSRTLAQIHGTPGT